MKRGVGKNLKIKFLLKLQKVSILVTRIPDISGKKSRHFQIVAANFLHEKASKLLICDKFQLKINKI